MKSFDHQKLDDQTRLVSRYVAGDLSRTERAEFEAWLVASPELAAEVEMEPRLRRGMASAARRGWLKRGAEASVPTGADRRWHMAIAASVVVALITLTVSVMLPQHRAAQLAELTTRKPIAMHLAAARTVRLGSVRGFGTSPDVIVARSEMPRELTIEPDVVVFTCEDGSIDLECAGGSAPRTPQYAEYEMDVVKRSDSAMAWRSQRQLAAAGATLSFVVPEPAKLELGDYDLLVRGHSPDHEEVVARFWLRVTDK